MRLLKLCLLMRELIGHFLETQSCCCGRDKLAMYIISYNCYSSDQLQGKEYVYFFLNVFLKFGKLLLLLIQRILPVFFNFCSFSYILIICRSCYSMNNYLWNQQIIFITLSGFLCFITEEMRCPKHNLLTMFPCANYVALIINFM